MRKGLLADRKLRPLITPTVVSLATVVFGASCSDDGASPGGSRSATDFTEPGEAAASYATAWQQRKADDLDALMAPTFAYFPRPADVPRIGWLSAASWDRQAELTLTANLLDPSFDGYADPVQSIEVEATVLASQKVPGGIPGATLDLTVTVLTGPASGYRAHSLLDMTFEEDAEGFLRVREMREIAPAVPRGVKAGVVDLSWALLRNEYRDPIPVLLTDPQEVIGSYALAWERREYAAIEALLAPDFEFHPVALDLVQLPWMMSDRWDRATELGITANMFDPQFVGAVPPATSIVHPFAILSTREIQAGTFEVVIDASVTVLVGPNKGWRSDTRFVVTVVEQPDGFLRIRKIEEVLKLAPRSTEGSSFAVVKAQWRR